MKLFWFYSTTVLMPFLIPILELFGVTIDNQECVQFFKRVVETTIKDRKANPSLQV